MLVHNLTLNHGRGCLLLAFFDWNDLVRDEPMGLPMHGGCRLWIRSINQAKDFACVFVEPVFEVLDAVIPLNLKVLDMCICDSSRGQPVDVSVNIHIKRHLSFLPVLILLIGLPNPKRRPARVRWVREFTLLTLVMDLLASQILQRVVACRWVGVQEFTFVKDLLASQILRRVVACRWVRVQEFTLLKWVNDLLVSQIIVRRVVAYSSVGNRGKPRA